MAKRVRKPLPKTMDEAIDFVLARLSDEDKEQLRGTPREGMLELHFGLGMWMQNNWGLWSGSRLAKWFNGHGIKHPDDMSGIILDSFWRHLNQKPIKLDEQVENYQDYWKKQETIQQSDPSDSEKAADGNHFEAPDK